MKLILTLTTLTSFAVSGQTLRNADTEVRSDRRLATVSGACTVANFAAAVGGKDKLLSLLGVSDSDLEATLLAKCDAASTPTMDFVDSIEKGPQFMKNFFDGGSPWNDYKQEGDNHILSQDAAIIDDNYPLAKTTVFTPPNGGANDKYPGYFSNFLFYGQKCRLGVIECCYKDTRLTDTLKDNAEMCALDMSPASKSNHISDKSFTIYQATDEDKTYCTGFTYDEDTFEEKVMFNTLYHVAFKQMLMTKGYVKNIPGAPMCGCIEQMPIITNADCTEVVEGYDIDESNGSITLNLSWKDCGEGLYEHYSKLDSKATTEDMFVREKIVGDGNCEDAVTSFMNEKMYVRIEG